MKRKRKEKIKEKRRKIKEKKRKEKEELTVGGGHPLVPNWENTQY
jgi:hypothetical protein